MQARQLKALKKACANWHGGQWSSLYQFASSGVYEVSNALNYVREIQDTINNQEHAPRPYEYSKRDVTRLEWMIQAFRQLAFDNGVFLYESKHSFYGYKTWRHFTHREDVEIQMRPYPR
jgi:hypothetical protein